MDGFNLNATNFHQLLMENKAIDEGFPLDTSITTTIGSLRNEVVAVPDNSIMSYTTPFLSADSNNNNNPTSTTSDNSNLATAIAPANSATTTATEFTKRKK